MASSTAPAAKAAFIALLQTAVGSDVPVRWAAPTEESDYRRDLVWFGSTEKDETARLGNNRRDEEYTLNLAAQCYRVGDDPQGTEEAWWDLHDEVATVLRQSPTLSDTLTSGAAQLVSSDVDLALAEKGWLAKGSIQVRCTAAV